MEKNIYSVDGGSSFLQSVDTRYNIRGWISSINNSNLTNDSNKNNDANDLFGMEISYQQPSVAITDEVGQTYNTKQLYDGNISAIRWKTNTQDPAQTPGERIYGFDYDIFKRFKNSYYATKSSGTWTVSAGNYNEAIDRYDANGNIGGVTKLLILELFFREKITTSFFNST